MFGTAQTVLSGAGEVVVENGAIVAETALDVTPVVGDVKGIYEAEGGLETAIAVGIAIAGPVGDGLKSGTRVLKAAGIIGPASRKVAQLTGEVRRVGESMSKRARDYQARVTGMEPGTAFVQGGAKFDGFDAATGTLIEAKYGMDFMAETSTGQFKSWAKFPKSAVEQARRQIDAANGARVEWRVSDGRVAKALREMFKERELDVDVKVVE